MDRVCRGTAMTTILSRSPVKPPKSSRDLSALSPSVGSAKTRLNCQAQKIHISGYLLRFFKTLNRIIEPRSGVDVAVKQAQDLWK